MKQRYEIMFAMARPKAHTDDVRERLLAEAGQMVLAMGVPGLSLRELATRAATSTSAIYSLFGSKAALLDALLESAYSSFAEDQESVQATDDPAMDLALLGARYLDWARTHRTYFHLMFGGPLVGLGPSPEVEAAMLRAAAPLRAGVERAQAAGRFRDDDTDTMVAALWAQVHGLAVLGEHGLLEGIEPLEAAYPTIRGLLAGPG